MRVEPVEPALPATALPQIAGRAPARWALLPMPTLPSAPIVNPTAGRPPGRSGARSAVDRAKTAISRGPAQ